MSTVATDNEWLAEAMRHFEHYELTGREIADGIHLNFDRQVVDERRAQSQGIREAFIKHMATRAPHATLRY